MTPLGPEWLAEPGPWQISERSGLRYRFTNYRRA